MVENCTRSFTAEERATLALSSVEGIGPATLRRLHQGFGSLAQAMAQRPERVMPFLRDGPTRARYGQLKDFAGLADRCIERARVAGARIVFPWQHEWPVQLQGLDLVPVLYVLGSLEPNTKRVAIVGSRKTDDYGEKLTTLFARSLVKEGLHIVSGGAVGVDSLAHRATLGAGGVTVAVLGSGIDMIYPAENKRLFEEMASRGGAVVSHFAPGTPGLPQNFMIRNRLIAALSDAVLVTRARAESGALSTARAAKNLQRPVFAIPGEITCPLAQGTNQLLEQGEARAVTKVSIIVKALNLEANLESRPSKVRPNGQLDWAPKAGQEFMEIAEGVLNGIEQPLTTAPAATVVEVPDEWKPVWDALGKGPMQFDELLEECQLDAGGLAHALVELELMGRCEERAGKVFVRK